MPDEVPNWNMNQLDYARVDQFRTWAHVYLIYSRQEPAHLFDAWQAMREMYRVMSQVVPEYWDEKIKGQFEELRNRIEAELKVYRQNQEFGEEYRINEDLYRDIDQLFDNVYKYKQMNNFGVNTVPRSRKFANAYAQALANRGGKVGKQPAPEAEGE